MLWALGEYGDSPHGLSSANTKKIEPDRLRDGKPYDNISFMEKRAALGILAALAHEVRLDVLRFLVERGPDGATAGRIGQAVSIPPSTLTFHLKKLRNAALVDTRRDGRTLVYVAGAGTVDALIAHLAEHYECGAQSKETRDRASPLVGAIAASIVSFFGSKKK